MPLRDHFRSPVNDTHSWDEVHGGWPGEIVRHLTTILPPGYRAGPRVRLGTSLEDNEGTFDPITSTAIAFSGAAGGGTTTLAALSPTLTIEADLADQDEYEVRIFDVERGRELVAAIKIVSPSNKDRPEARQLFITKVSALLRQDVCVSLVDLVTVRQTNLYAELLARFDGRDPALGSTPPNLYAVTLQSQMAPKRRRPLLDAWFYPMMLGQPLPTLPIWLKSDYRVLLPLETSYEETCRVLGIA